MIFLRHIGARPASQECRRDIEEHQGERIVRNLYPFLWRAAVVFFVAVGRIITALSTFDFRLYSSNETLVQESTNLPVASIGSTETGALRISSDGLRAMGNGYLIDLLP